MIYLLRYDASCESVEYQDSTNQFYSHTHTHTLILGILAHSWASTFTRGGRKFFSHQSLSSVTLSSIVTQNIQIESKYYVIFQVGLILASLGLILQASFQTTSLQLYNLCSARPQPLVSLFTITNYTFQRVFQIVLIYC